MDNCGLICGCVGSKGNLSSLLLRWMLAFVLSKNSVLAIGNLMQSWGVSRSRLSAPPYFSCK
jgi:hypothetical protein